MKSKVVIVRGNNAYSMVQKGLDELNIDIREDRVVVKPNLIINEPYPTTTSPETVEALVKYLRKFGKEIIIAEGSGWCETWEAFRDLGYIDLAKKYGLKLVDLNRDRYEVRKRLDALTLKKFELPITLKNSYLISAAVLKTHSLTGVTLSLKNMMGATIGEEIEVAKKRRFHRRLNESIVDINLYLKPNLAVIDGRKACIGGELGGIAKEMGVMIFSNDLVAADTVGARLLGFDPMNIRYLKLAQAKGLGTADLEKVDVVELR